MANGRSAYQLWLDEGYEGSVYDFFRWLRGPQGERGQIGERGPRGFEGPPGPPGLSGGAARVPGEPNGFDDYTKAVLSWDDATRTLTVSPSSSDGFSVWSDGMRFRSNDPKSIQIEDVEGPHFIYFDTDGELKDVSTFEVFIIREKAFVALIYWDATNGRAVPHPICETHGATMDGASHEYLHDVNGTQYRSGMSTTVASVDGNGDTDDDISFSITAGKMWDEDIKHDVVAHALDDNIAVIYREGAEGDWRVDDTTPYPGIKGTTYLYWNESTGTTWQLTEAGNNDYVLAHIWAFPGLNIDDGRYVVIMGQGTYLTKSEAQAGSLTEMGNLQINPLPSQEFVPVATLILETAGNKTNTLAASIISTDSGDDYVSWL